MLHVEVSMAGSAQANCTVVRSSYHHVVARRSLHAPCTQWRCHALCALDIAALQHVCIADTVLCYYVHKME